MDSLFWPTESQRGESLGCGSRASFSTEDSSSSSSVEPLAVQLSEISSTKSSNILAAKELLGSLLLKTSDGKMCVTLPLSVRVESLTLLSLPYFFQLARL